MQSIQGSVNDIGPRVESVERATGYIVGNGNTGAAGRVGTRLNGIKPKTGDFDPVNNDYETVLD